MRPRRLCFFVTASAGVMLAVACNSFDAGSTEPTDTDASTAARDVDVVDSPRDAIRTDGGAGCANLIVNAGFEDQSDCLPWINHGGTASDAVPAHSGLKACGPCTSAGGAVNLVAWLEGQSFAPGEGVHVEAWVRASDGGLFAQSARLYVGTNTTNAGDPARVTLSYDYQRVSADYTIPADGGAAQFPVINVTVSDRPDGGGGCILVDDVRACRSDGG